MNNASKSILVFGIYILAGGMIFIIIPGPFFSLIEIKLLNDFIIRALGFLLICYGYFYIRAGLIQKGMNDFYSWTVHTRVLSPVFLFICIISGIAHPMVMIFGAADILGALWTLFALRSENSKVNH